MILTKKIWKSGTGLVITLDKIIAKKMKLKKGDLVEINIKKVKNETREL